ncbi:MAG: M23 family metallopeptidase [Thermodesulfobacteriota bacterium]|nr:M23 family metallopeptidase [Thermodesulfobacteriota bacterium]
MKKIFILANLIFFLFPAYLYPFQSDVTTDNGQISIRSEYRRLFRGEVIKITLRSPGFSSAKAHFEGKDYTFVPAEDPSISFLLISLGLDAEPGIHDLNIRIEFTDGSERDFLFKVYVSKGKFLSKRIKVDRRFTSPSPEEQERIMKEVELTRAVYREFTPRWLGNGKFIVPVKERIKKNFGERRIFNDGFQSRHRGIDILSPAGTPVRASNSGRIALTRDLYFAGNTVIINHGLGLFSLYCHLSKICVGNGRSIKKGEIIGYAGATGRVTGPHLHWGFKLFDDYINPLSVVYLSF